MGVPALLRTLFAALCKPHTSHLDESIYHRIETLAGGSSKAALQLSPPSPFHLPSNPMFDTAQQPPRYRDDDAGQGQLRASSAEDNEHEETRFFTKHLSPFLPRKISENSQAPTAPCPPASSTAHRDGSCECPGTPVRGTLRPRSRRNRPLPAGRSPISGIINMRTRSLRRT